VRPRVLAPLPALAAAAALSAPIPPSILAGAPSAAELLADSRVQAAYLGA